MDAPFVFFPSLSIETTHNRVEDDSILKSRNRCIAILETWLINETFNGHLLLALLIRVVHT